MYLLYMGHFIYFSHEYENQQELERKSSFSSEFDGQSSISESEASTAPSSLQTIVRSPYKSQQGSMIGNQSNPTSGYVLSWNGSDYAWVVQSGGIASVLADTSPQ